MTPSSPAINSSIYHNLPSVLSTPLILLLPNSSTVSNYQNQRSFKKNFVFILLKFTIAFNIFDQYLQVVLCSHGFHVFCLPPTLWALCQYITFDGSSTSNRPLYLQGFRYDSKALSISCLLNSLSNLSSFLGFKSHLCVGDSHTDICSSDLSSPFQILISTKAACPKLKP